MNSLASQITSLTIVYSTVYSRADQRKHQSSTSLAFVWGIHRWPVNSPHKWPVTQKMFPFHDVIVFRCWKPTLKLKKGSVGCLTPDILRWMFVTRYAFYSNWRCNTVRVVWCLFGASASATITMTYSGSPTIRNGPMQWTQSALLQTSQRPLYQFDFVNRSESPYRVFCASNNHVLRALNSKMCKLLLEPMGYLPGQVSKQSLWSIGDCSDNAI